jgi:hypothetical protein
MLAIFLFTAFLVIRTAPDSLLGKALRRGLVDWPAGKLSRLTRGQMICWLGFALAIWAAIAILGHDAVAIGGALPETMAWLATFDASIVADALVAAVLIATQTRLSGMRARLRSMLSRSRRSAPRARAPRRQRRTRAPKPGNDDEPAPAFGYPLAA